MSDNPFAPAAREQVKARIEAKSARSETGCLIWKGRVLNSGYGAIYAFGRPTVVHRAAYAAEHGEIPAGLDIDHLCRVRLRAEPTHLEAVTPAVNRQRQGAAVTHCKRGHEYAPKNTYRHPAAPASRSCRTCARELARARRNARKATA